MADRRDLRVFPHSRLMHFQLPSLHPVSARRLASLYGPRYEGFPFVPPAKLCLCGRGSSSYRSARRTVFLDSGVESLVLVPGLQCTATPRKSAEGSQQAIPYSNLVPGKRANTPGSRSWQFVAKTAPTVAKEAGTELEIEARRG